MSTEPVQTCCSYAYRSKRLIVDLQVAQQQAPHASEAAMPLTAALGSLEFHQNAGTDHYLARAKIGEPIAHAAVTCRGICSPADAARRGAGIAPGRRHAART